MQRWVICLPRSCARSGSPRTGSAGGSTGTRTASSTSTGGTRRGGARTVGGSLAAAALVFTLACGSTEPTVDPNTVSVVGTFQLASQNTVDPAGVFIPNTVTYINYSSDQYTLGSDGSWTRVYAGTRRQGTTSTPTSGTEQGTYLRNLSSLTFRQGTTIVRTAVITTTGIEIRDNYFIYDFRR